ncbi:MAG TPA: glycerate kinase [Propionibacteriaceae bacterium]|nr:glycerate kinase [Propionibacteriaceae bacterium]
MRVLIAPDKFKGCLTAVGVAEALQLGLLDERPGLDVTVLPVADGGDGTVDAALRAGYSECVVDASGPTGQPLRTAYALAGDRAVIELAAVVGLDLLPDGRLDPLGATTYGLGLVIKDAIARGATEIVLGLGGSASTDGGAGLAQALGARLLDASGADLPPGGGALAGLAKVDLAPLRATLGTTRIIVATDVDNPLLGPNGAAAVFGPQKGASPADVATLDAALANWSRVVSGTIGRDEATRPGAGAAGGAGYAALALLNASIHPGIELILALIDFEARLPGADLVITGEGSLDEQSLAGKAPIGVARAAGTAGVPVVAVAGRSLLSPLRLAQAGIAAAYPLSDLEPDPQQSIANAAPLLRQVGRRIAKEWLP